MLAEQCIYYYTHKNNLYPAPVDLQTTVVIRVLQQYML